MTREQDILQTCVLQSVSLWDTKGTIVYDNAYNTDDATGDDEDSDDDDAVGDDEDSDDSGDDDFVESIGDIVALCYFPTYPLTWSTCCSVIFSNLPSDLVFKNHVSLIALTTVT